MSTELQNVLAGKSKLNILIVGPAHPLRGGLATYDERLCREFIAMGHTCEILSFSLQYPNFLFPGKTQFSDDPKPSDLKIYSEINSINPLNWLYVGLVFKRRKYDVVVFRYWMSFMGPAFGSIARILKVNKGARILAITDNIYPHEKRFFDKPFTSYFLKSCDGFLTMSKEVLAQVASLEPNKPRVYVPHPMYDMFGSAKSKEDACKALNLDPNAKYLLFFGFIRKYKGLQLLLESFARFDHKKNEVKLIVAGEFYEDGQPYLDQIQALGIEEAVILRTEFIPNGAVADYFCASDLVVQTYLNATQSGVTQIGYFYDKPMLVTNVGGLAELVPNKEGGYVVEPIAEEVAASLEDFFLNRRKQQFEERIRIEKLRFTWSYLCEQLIGLSAKP